MEPSQLYALELLGKLNCCLLQKKMKMMRLIWTAQSGHWNSDQTAFVFRYISKSWVGFRFLPNFRPRDYPLNAKVWVPKASYVVAAKLQCKRSSSTFFIIISFNRLRLYQIRYTAAGWKLAWCSRIIDSVTHIPGRTAGCIFAKCHRISKRIARFFQG